MTSSHTPRLPVQAPEGIKSPVATATTATITLSGLQTVNGYTLNVNDRVLVKDQDISAENGIYVALEGDWVRSQDWKVGSQVANGAIVLDNNTGDLWRANYAGVLDVDTTAVTFNDVVAGGGGNTTVEIQPRQTATEGQTVFSTPISYYLAPKFFDVHLGGGAWLRPGADFTINTNGDLILTDGVTAGTWLDVVLFRPKITTVATTAENVGEFAPIQVANMAALRNVTAYYDGQQFELLGHTNAGVGGGTFYYDAADTTSADDNGMVAVTTGEQRLKRRDTEFVTPEMFGALRTEATDTAAVQSIADAGFLCAYLIPADAAYKFKGITSTTRHFHFKGLVGADNVKPVIDVDGTILTIGANTGAKVDDSVNYENITFNVIGDCVGGILDLRSCRNWEIDKTVQVIATQEYWIGTLVKGSRAYQFNIAAVMQAKGISMMEIGDTAGGEVLDTCGFKDAFYAGNAAIFQRDLIRNFNFHNIDLTGMKCREFFSSDEATLANQGVTYITAAVTAGDTSIIVNDATQLKQGNLAANDLIYIGYRNVAELVRISSVAGNVITLDTPCRFDHAADVESTGFGEPVIFGPVYITLDVPRGLYAGVLHTERAFIAMNIYSPFNMNIINHHGTSKYMYGMHNTGRSNKVQSIYGGDAGYTGDVKLIYRFPSAATYQEPLEIGTFPELIASWSPWTDDSINTEPLVAYRPNIVSVIDRTFAETYIEARRTAKTIVQLDGATNSVRLQTGTFVGQIHEVVFQQDATGYRLVYGFDAGNTPSVEFLASMAPYSTRSITFQWNGTNWIEISRSVRTGSILPTFVFTEISDITSTLNVDRKEDDMLIINDTDLSVYRAVGGSAGDDWVAVDNTNTITPV